METCSCTGRTSVVLPTSDDCCPSGSDCMTITVHQFSGNYLLADTHLSTPQTAVTVAYPTMAVPQVLLRPTAQTKLHSSPPGGRTIPCVLRV